MTTGVVTESPKERSVRLRKERYARYVLAHPERRQATLQRYRERTREKNRLDCQAFRERCPDYGKDWYAKNRAKVMAQHAAWKKEHRQAVRLHSHKRRLKIKELGLSVPASRINELFSLQRGKCACCTTLLTKSGYHIDHIMPLVHGGAHEAMNIQLLCPDCNLRKAAKHPIRFMQERGMLL